MLWPFIINDFQLLLTHALLILSLLEESSDLSFVKHLIHKIVGRKHALDIFEFFQLVFFIPRLNLITPRNLIVERFRLGHRQYQASSLNLVTWTPCWVW